jgi:hypothetical protein
MVKTEMVMVLLSRFTLPTSGISCKVYFIPKLGLFGHLTHLCAELGPFVCVCHLRVPHMNSSLAFSALPSSPLPSPGFASPRFSPSLSSSLPSLLRR